jgi:hypothetical protein
MSEIIIRGIVIPEDVKKMGLAQDEWYFVDYSEDEHAVSSWFRVIMDDEFEDNFAKLIECYPDAMYKWNSIPRGYKSICRFEFDRQINSLSYITSWTKGRGKKNLHLIKLNIAQLREQRINDILND